MRITGQIAEFETAYKKVARFVGKAVHRYDMIRDGDRILVGLSGGKDSLTLLRMLTYLQSRAPISFQVQTAHVDPGFDGGFSEELAAYCFDWGYRVRIEKTDYGIIAHGPENRENPCFLCSRLRRKRLFEVADEIGCNKIALGHNKDDLIETLLINMLYAGEISTMKPVQPFFGGRFEVIRPLIFVDESTIQWFAKKLGMQTFQNPCPSAGTSKRKEVKSMLEGMYRSNPKIKGNLFRAMRHVKIDYLL